MHKIFGYQKLSETQKSSHTKFFGTVRQKFSYEIVVLRFHNTVSRHQKLSDMPKGPLHEFFLGYEAFSTSFYDMLHQTFATRQMSSVTNFQEHQKLSEIQGPLLNFRYCDTVRQKVFEIFRWCPLFIYRSLRAEQMSSVDFDVLEACSSFCELVFGKESSHFSCAVFSFWNLLDSCIIRSRCYVAPTWNAANPSQASFMFSETVVHFSFLLFHITITFDILWRFCVFWKDSFFPYHWIIWICFQLFEKLAKIGHFELYLHFWSEFHFK